MDRLLVQVPCPAAALLKYRQHVRAVDSNKDANKDLTAESRYCITGKLLWPHRLVA